MNGLQAHHAEPASIAGAVSDTPAAAPVVDCQVVILTFNCRDIIADTIAQARRLCAQPLVVDSHSADGTDALARSLGCRVEQRAFLHYADQRNWAIDLVGGSARWQLHLDADEVLDDEAVAAIQAVLDERPPADTAFLLRRVDYFMGRALRFSGVNPWHLRLFPSGLGRCEDRLYDQHFVSPLRTRRLAGSMHDRNALSLADWTARHNRWSDLEVAELRLRRDAERPGATDDAGTRLTPRLTGDARERTRFLKSLYYRLPASSRAIAYFVWRYVFRLGVLDGRAGFYFAFFQALWFRMLVDAKLFEARQTPAAPAVADARERPGVERRSD